MSRPPSDFKVATIEFQNGSMVETDDMFLEPKESASYWKAVADSQRVRLDRAVEANRDNRQGRIKAENRVVQLKAQLEAMEKAKA